MHRRCSAMAAPGSCPAPVAETEPDIELVLAGPHIDPRQPRPENAAVRAGLLAARDRLPEHVRRRVHVWSLEPCSRAEEATAINLLQRLATVVTQNSIREALGLTVAEAMWKRATVLASAVGGIRDLISDGVNGLLSEDTGGGPAWSARLVRALRAPADRDRWGRAARETVRERYLAADTVQPQLAALGLAGARGPKASRGD